MHSVFGKLLATGFALPLGFAVHAAILHGTIMSTFDTRDTHTNIEAVSLKAVYVEG